MRHILIAAGINAALALLYLLALFDFAGFTKDEVIKYKDVFYGYLNVCVLRLIYAAFIVALLMCPSKVWYGIVSVLKILHASSTLIITSIVLRNYIIACNGQMYEPFKFGKFGTFVCLYASSFVTIYIAAILIKLSVFSPSKPKDLYVIQVVGPSSSEKGSRTSSEKQSEASSSQMEKTEEV
ncbi:uncharacterized protein CELE_ZK39.10 [Caenorhabditis elegans]|uniref:Uncharacterized protein n=1 Tax=Caenorhabditis elegans TaxID=6239 RepID=A7YPF2_CAEEL|nr:Uncharacterized protein CELE_ZK39.10 [Caenorhabditis elegans]CAP03132.1 Uncharacterized protein CELE_ZK39.10 [Caenorhabditis elegans]|eukprot:NP_001122566.1 Uncharacterized protein CELE_ZK39.10 [Caenorhabditis elegans]